MGIAWEAHICSHYSKGKNDMQEREKLEDRKKNGRKRPWCWKKVGAVVMSDVYRRLGMMNKAARMARCADHLTFKEYGDGEKILHSAFFCKVRLCPTCAMRRSEKLFGQISRVMNYMDNSAECSGYRYIFLTLTVRNVPGDDLSDALDKLFYGFHLMVHNAKFKRLSKGWFRALEVTHNWEREDYHPHLHMIIAVDEKYITEKENYLDHDGWKNLWRSCMDLGYDPWIHVRAVRADKEKSGKDTIKLGKAVAELAKYTVKDDDYMVMWVNDENGKKVHVNKLRGKAKKDAEDRMDGAVAVLDSALHKRRLAAFGGKLREVHKLLNLDDPIDGNLLKIDDDEIRDDLDYVLNTYRWHVGIGNYVLVKNNENIEHAAEHKS